MNYVALKRKDALPLIKATFPDYNGRKIRLIARETVTIHYSSLNWSGGTRSQFRACTLDGQPSGNLDAHNMSAPWSKPAGSTSFPIPQGYVLVEHIMFCGKDLGLRVYVNPADMPRLLPSA